MYNSSESWLFKRLHRSQWRSTKHKDTQKKIDTHNNKHKNMKVLCEVLGFKPFFRDNRGNGWFLDKIRAWWALQVTLLLLDDKKKNHSVPSNEIYSPVLFHSEMQNTHICNLIQPDGIAFAGYWCSCFVFGCVAKLILTEVISYPPAYNSRFNIVWGFEPSGCLRKLISFTVTEEINLFLLQRRKTKYWEQMILVSIYS